MKGSKTSKKLYRKAEYADYDAKEILKLNTMLDNAKIPHRTHRLDDGWQVIYTPYHPDFWVTDAIETYYSYGVDDDLLELAGDS